MSDFIRLTHLPEFEDLKISLEEFNKNYSNIDKFKQISNKIITFCLNAGSYIKWSDEKADIICLSNIQIGTNDSSIVNDLIVALNQFIEANNKFIKCLERYQYQNRIINLHFEPHQLFNNTYINEKGYTVSYTNINGESCELYFDSSDNKNHSSKYLADQALRSKIINELPVIRAEIISTFRPIFQAIINLKSNDPCLILSQQLKWTEDRLLKAQEECNKKLESLRDSTQRTEAFQATLDSLNKKVSKSIEELEIARTSLRNNPNSKDESGDVRDFYGFEQVLKNHPDVINFLKDRPTEELIKHETIEFFRLHNEKFLSLHDDKNAFEWTCLWLEFKKKHYEHAVVVKEKSACNDKKGNMYHSHEQQQRQYREACQECEELSKQNDMFSRLVKEKEIADTKVTKDAKDTKDAKVNL